MAELIERDGVRGFLHRPDNDPICGLVLTHGAGANCETPLLNHTARELARLGVAVLRCDLPFRQTRPKGPPWPAGAAADRDGLRRAADLLRESAGEVWIGGHSYGGRQASMLAAEDATVAAGLLLLSYPLHPPEKPDQLRTAHLPSLHMPALFIQGDADPFGSPEEMRAAVALIPARTELHVIEGAKHDLGGKKHAARIAGEFAAFAGVLPAEAVEIPITDVFDLHTVPPAEVEPVLEAYLEEARRKGFHALRIIHGRGIGVQREIVRTVLARTPGIEHFGDAPAEAGGWGATVVTLAE